MNAPAPIVPAATVLLLRPEADGFSVLMVKRHRRSGFLPDAWVFPGGRVEPEDASLDPRFLRGGGVAAGLGPMGLGFLVGAARETFEEAGVWLGEGAPTAEVRAELARGRARLHDVIAATGGVLDLDRMVPWSRWVTPVGEPRRFDTLFLVAVADGQVADHDAHETVASAWLRPSDVLRASLAELPVAPPTWWTLRELAAHAHLDDVLAEATRRSVAPIEPLLDLEGDTLGILLPGHARHPEPARADVPRRIALGEQGWFLEP